MNPGEVIVFLLMSLVMISLIVAVAITRRNVLKARHIERMAMIEKGMHPDDIGSEGAKLAQVPAWMKIGSSVTGIGAGFVIGTLMEGWFAPHSEVLVLGSVLFMGGVGLSLPYFINAYFHTHAEK